MEFKSITFSSSINLQELDRNNTIFDDFSLRNIFSGFMGNTRNDELERLLYMPLRNIDDIFYRQEIFKDLENPEIYRIITQFAGTGSQIFYNIKRLKDLYDLQRERWLLDSVYMYSRSIENMLDNMRKAGAKSRGFTGFINYLDAYVASDEFKSLKNDAEQLEEELSSIRYLINIKGVKITVREDRDSKDYASEVKEAFSRFLDEDETIPGYDSTPGFGHVEAAVVELVAKFYPEQFNRLKDFYKRRLNFMDPVISRFLHEIFFYLKYLQYITPLEESGLQFCIPEIKGETDRIYCLEFFDLALAAKLNERKQIPVTNNIIVNRNSSVIIVTGPNNGGKTTFARSFGQLHYLALLGCPVPGKEATILHVDNIFSHFEISENPENNMGRLEEELERLHGILEKATERSLIIINEMLSSTTLKDGIEIGRNIIDKIKKMKSICMYVTFIHELSDLPGVVSYVSQVDRKYPEKRTYKVLPMKSNGMAYAMALARKYNLTYEILKGRIS
ncbi:MutS-related protein [Ferroplasma acidarmanus]|uniref:DNA mismatch repair proteins mutS family domain-containing protein n=1 Tax=Ferroplasma acidarmanus Fer1 TaxID=333146 RepID=S0AU03_FERAC|nr:MutS-like ATPase involved in mismatch repair [Ferroplasma acidarmanus]AGO61774.1 hypothetical protein FACI_IFERC00001G1796 [Ferroplasma acidarmanus Fer1]